MRVFLVRTLLRLLARASLPALHATGRLIGTCLWLIPNRLRTVTEINLALCYPDKDAAWRNALGRTSLIETGKSICELAALWRWPVARIDSLVVECQGWEHIEQARQQQRGLILLTPHCGCWELLGVYVPQRMPMTAMYRPPRDPGFEPLLREIRERAGARLVPTTTHGIRALYKALGAGESIILLPDQEPRKGAGVFAPFFGTQAYTMVLSSRLARKTEAAIVILCMERLPRGRGYRLHVRPLDTAIRDADPVIAATAANHSVEQTIDINPAQYMWNYKRFRRKPQGQDRRYNR